MINLGLNLLVVPVWGILGAAIIALIAYSVFLGIVAHYSLKEFRFHVDWNFILKSLIASLAMSLVVWWMALAGNVATIVAVIIGVLMYAAILFLLKGFSWREFRFFGVCFKEVFRSAASPSLICLIHSLCQ